MLLDKTIKTAEERTALVNEIIANTPSEKLTPYYLEALANYILEPTIQSKEITTKNRLVTINERETSFEGLVGRLEAGEDGLYNMITNDKNIIHRHKYKITQEDIETIPPLKELREAIEKEKRLLIASRGTARAGKLKRQIIEMSKDQYVIKKAYQPSMYCINAIKSMTKFDLTDDIYIDSEGIPHNNCVISLFNPEHISDLLCNYSRLKEDSWDKLSSDSRWMMEDLDATIEVALRRHPMLRELLICKIDGLSNTDIQQIIFKKFGIHHTVEYISALWRNKIPTLIAETAQLQYLEWYYTFQEKGEWKKCSRCGQIKLACTFNFSRNRTSKDGWYSICKDCRKERQE